MFQIWSRNKVGEEKKFRESVSWEGENTNHNDKIRGSPLAAMAFL